MNSCIDQSSLGHPGGAQPVKHNPSNSTHVPVTTVSLRNMTPNVLSATLRMSDNEDSDLNLSPLSREIEIHSSQLDPLPRLISGCSATSRLIVVSESSNKHAIVFSSARSIFLWARTLFRFCESYEKLLTTMNSIQEVCRELICCNPCRLVNNHTIQT